MIAFAMRAALFVLSLGSVGIFLVLGAVRLRYPLELDCIEGVIMDHVIRLTHGQPIYVQPTLSFISLAYMPFFIWVSSVIASVFGPGFWVPRLVSLLSCWGIATLIALIVHRETRDRTLALGAGAVYLMGFGFAGSCYDVGRPDSLMLFLTFSALVILRWTTSVRGAVIAAILLGVAFFTKQHAVWFAIAGGVHLAVNDRRRLPAYALTVVLCFAGGYFLLSRWLGPWFSFYTWEVPAGWSRPSAVRVISYLGDGLIAGLGVLFIPTLLSLGLVPRPWLGPRGLWAWVGLGAVMTGLMATLDPSAYRHVFIPSIVAFSILGPISLYRLATEAIAVRADRHSATAIACGVLALQFVPMIYTLHSNLPRPRALEAHARLIENLRQQHGEVLVPYHGFYDWTAGKGTSLHIIALDDILRARGNRLLRRDPHFFERLFEPLRTGPNRPAIVTDVELEQSGSLWASLAPYYTLQGELGWITNALRPITGNRFSPTYIYVPREPGEPTTPAGTAQSGATSVSTPATRPTPSGAHRP